MFRISLFKTSHTSISDYHMHSHVFATLHYSPSPTSSIIYIEGSVEISIYRMPGKIKFRIKITEIIIITKTLSTIDDDIRSNVTLHTHIQNTS